MLKTQDVDLLGYVCYVPRADLEISCQICQALSFEKVRKICWKTVRHTPEKSGNLLKNCQAPSRMSVNVLENCQAHSGKSGNLLENVRLPQEKSGNLLENWQTYSRKSGNLWENCQAHSRNSGNLLENVRQKLNAWNGLYHDRENS